MPNNKKLLVGVTGNIGSGKSLVCDYLSEFGCTVFNADEIAKEMYSSNKELVRELRKRVPSIFLNDKVSLSELREFLFKNKQNQMLINSIVHPFVIEEILKRAAKSRSKIVVIEAALIYESHFDELLNYVIVVTSTLSNRIQRVRKRNKLSIRQIMNISKLQISEKIKVQKGDFVIKNNESKKELKRVVSYIYDTLEKLAK